MRACNCQLPKTFLDRIANVGCYDKKVQLGRIGYQRYACFAELRSLNNPARFE